MRNKELIDRYLINLKGRIRGIDGRIARQEISASELRKELKQVEEKIEELEGFLEKYTSPMRHG